MKKFEVFACEKCGWASNQAEPVEEHEKKCLSLVVGQKVKFRFELLSFEGRITALNAPDHFGAKAMVDIETEDEITEVDQLHDGRHIWVERDQVKKILLPRV